MLTFCHSIQHKYVSFTKYNLPGTIDGILLAPAFCYFIENGDVFLLIKVVVNQMMEESAIKVLDIFKLYG